MSNEFVGTMPVQERHQFDVGHLEEYMQAHVEGFSGPLEVEQFKGGQSNPTFRLKGGDGTRYVMRRKPPGKLLPSAHAVDREYRVITALRDTDVPVPRTYCLCEDDDVIGTAFYIMEYKEGRVIWDQTLPDMDNAGRRAVYEEMNRVIAALHNVDFKAIGLDDFGKHGEYVARQIHRWSKQYRASETETIPEMNRLMEWLPEHIPESDKTATAIVHGDYRLDNLMFHPTEPRIFAVLDWELSTLGHPLADFAYHCMSWHIPADLMRGIGGVDVASLGIPTEQEYVQLYRRNTGRAEIGQDEWDFYMAYNLFRIAAISQGIMGRVKDGTAASEHAVEAGKRARPMAELAWKQVQKILDRR